MSKGEKTSSHFKIQKSAIRYQKTALFLYKTKITIYLKRFSLVQPMKVGFFSPFTNIFPPVYLLKYICTCLNWDKNYIWEVWFNDFEITYHYHFLQKLHNSHNNIHGMGDDFEWIDFFSNFLYLWDLQLSLFWKKYILASSREWLRWVPN